MQERLSRFEEWARKKRELLISVMKHAGLKRLVEPDFTVRAADTTGAAGGPMSTDRMKSSGLLTPLLALE